MSFNISWSTYMSIEKIIYGLQNDQLIDINFSKIKLTSQELRSLLAAIKQNKSMRSLTINLSRIDAEQLALFIDTIKSHANIRSLTAICKKDADTASSVALLEIAFKSDQKVNLNINIISKSYHGFFKSISTVSNRTVDTNLQPQATNLQAIPYIPSDVVLYIFNKLDGQDLLNVANTSKKWALKLAHSYHKSHAQNESAAKLNSFIIKGQIPANINCLFRNTLMKDFFLKLKAKIEQEQNAIPTVDILIVLPTTGWGASLIPLNQADRPKYDKYLCKILTIRAAINGISETTDTFCQKLNPCL